MHPTRRSRPVPRPLSPSTSKGDNLSRSGTKGDNTRDKAEPIKNFAKAWKKGTKAACLPDRILLFDFRRTAVRNLVLAGVAETIAMKLTGHKTRAVFDRYDITSGRDLREAVEKLAAFHQGATLT